MMRMNILLLKDLLHVIEREERSVRIWMMMKMNILLLKDLHHVIVGEKGGALEL